jgi:c-di-GMP-specific phosphodiesterase
MGALTVSVNLSTGEIDRPGLVADVAETLRVNRLPRGALKLEVTESDIMRDPERAAVILRTLREAGAGLALDDFGTGFSSLGMLDSVRVHELKIDRGFVAAMDSSPRAAALVRLTIELGRSLDMLVVAEGVESEEQRRALWALGCPAGQGHLFGRPMSIDALLSVLREGGGLAGPLHASAENVIELPLARRGESVG